MRGDLVVRHGQRLVDVMARSGCVEVAIGIESGSDRILQTIHKGENTSDIRYYINVDMRLLNCADLTLRRSSRKLIRDIIPQLTDIKNEIINALPDELRKKA